MYELQVWGIEGEISVISPECLASAWLLSEKFGEEFVIIPSNNTNYSEIGRLPVLIDDITKKKYQGFEEIAGLIGFEPDNLELELFNQSLIKLLLNEFEILNQFNLYINTKNYSNYTIKLFKNYLPFPTMYNQPLKFRTYAQNMVQILGLHGNKRGLFNFTNSSVATTDTENIDETDDDGDETSQVALTGLHEKQLLKKSKQRNLLQESKNSFKCLNILNTELNSILEMYKKYPSLENNTNKYLLHAYLFSFMNKDLPDQFIKNNLFSKNQSFMETVVEESNNRNEKLKSYFSSPKIHQIPSLLNEIKYITGFIQY